MDTGRCILHSDMNSFYASVEIMLDPSLRGRPIAVCGCSEDRHGIILAKSTEAKAAGVQTGMVNHEALQRCPGLILVLPHYDQYLKYSRLARAIYESYTDQVESFGMDECWLDVTCSTSAFGSGMDIAEEIRHRVQDELGLTVSIGVSFNKIFAKLGSDMKKPNAITQIRPEDVPDKIWPLPLGDLLYAGRSTTRRLAGYGILTIGDLANTDPLYLKHYLGINGVRLWQYANGTDHARVMHRGDVTPIQSIGHGITCISDLLNEEEVWHVTLALCQDIGHKLHLHHFTARGVQVTVRSNDLQFVQFQAPLPFPTSSSEEIAHYAFRLFRQRYSWSIPVRAISIRATHLQDRSTPVQLDLEHDGQYFLRREKVQDAVESIRQRFGKNSVTMACLLNADLKMPTDGRDKVRMPGLMYH